VAVDVEALRRLAMGLPHVDDRSGPDRLAFEVAGKGIAWTYLLRAAPKTPRLPQIGVLAVRCELVRKEMLIESAPDRFFDDDHYKGYPAVLVRLNVIDEDELAGLLRDAWRLQAPKKLQGELP
jgi:hypothetical protein